MKGHLSTENTILLIMIYQPLRQINMDLGLVILDILPIMKIWKFGLKNIDFRFNHYDRNDGLSANILLLE